MDGSSGGLSTVDSAASRLKYPDRPIRGTYAAALETGAGLVAQYGLFVLLVVFALEGALVGKVIPTRALFVAAVLAVGADSVGAATVVATAVVGATLGQLLLFGAVRYAGVAPRGLPGSDSGGGRLADWFDRWGLSAVALSNALPLARGSLTVPAAMAEETPVRFSASSAGRDVGLRLRTAGGRGRPGLPRRVALSTRARRPPDRCSVLTP